MPPSVVLVVFDALRKDLLPAYGGGASTPNLDSFGAEGCVYGNCVAPSPWTIPSHASMFTGRFPAEHGVRESYEMGLSDTLGLMKNVKGSTLAEVLGKKGYQTVGLPANATLTLREGFERGFESFKAYERRLVSPEDLALIHRTFEKGKGKVGTALDLISRGKVNELWRLYSTYRLMKKEARIADFPRSKGGNFLLDRLSSIKLTPPFFLFVNFMETHEPYTSFEQKHSNLGPFNSVHTADLYEYKKIPSTVVDELKRAYSDTVSRADEYFGRLVGMLKRMGLYDDCLVIATSDHGQEFKEHGFYTHGTFLHREIVDVPLLIKYPGGKKPVVGKGYQNLCGIYPLVTETSEGVEAAMTSTAETFSEAFGVVHKPPVVADPSLKARLDEVRARVDRPRRAVYREGYRFVVDWSTGEVEEFAFNGKELDPSMHGNIRDSLLNDLLEFEKGEVREAPSAAPMSREEEEEVSARLRDLGYL